MAAAAIFVRKMSTFGSLSLENRVWTLKLAFHARGTYANHTQMWPSPWRNIPEDSCFLSSRRKCHRDWRSNGLCERALLPLALGERTASRWRRTDVSRSQDITLKVYQIKRTVVKLTPWKKRRGIERGRRENAERIFGKNVRLDKAWGKRPHQEDIWESNTLMLTFRQLLVSVKKKHQGRMLLSGPLNMHGIMVFPDYAGQMGFAFLIWNVSSMLNHRLG